MAKAVEMHPIVNAAPIVFYTVPAEEFATALSSTTDTAMAKAYVCNSNVCAEHFRTA